MSSFLSAGVHNKVHFVLKHGPAHRPRAMLQAYNAFLNRWAVVRLQGAEHSFDPDLLTLLLLLQYAWPNLYNQISANPFYFLYLHALATGKPNASCGPTQIDELRDLGLPILASDSLLRVYSDLDLARVLSVWEFDHNRSNQSEGELLSHLSLHITLNHNIKEQELMFREEQAWDALNSGDPARIKLAHFHAPVFSFDYESQLLDILTQLNEEIDQGIDNDNESHNKENNVIERAEAVIFALGLVGEEKSVEILHEQLRPSSNMPLRIQLRAIYALGNHVNRRDDENALSILVDEILCCKEEIYGPAIRSRVGRLARYFKLRYQQIVSFISLLIPQNEHIKVIQAVKESLRRKENHWKQEALRLLTPEMLKKMQPIDVVDICEAISWPFSLGPYLIDIVIQDSSLASRAFRLITNFGTSSKDKKYVIAWLAQLLQSSERFRGACWQIIGTLQKDLSVSWQDSIWQQLLEFAIKNDDKSIMYALEATQRAEANDLIAQLPWEVS